MLRNKDGVIIVDNTKLGSLSNCEWLYWIQHELHQQQPGEAAPLKQGSDGHEALAYFFSSNTWMDYKGALELFESLYRSWAQTNVEYDDRFAWPNQHKVLETYFTRLKTTGIPFEVLAVEMPFEIPITVPIPGLLRVSPNIDIDILFTGKFDLIVKYQDNIYVLDHKFTGSYLNASWCNQFRTSSQLTGYIWAAQQLGYQEVNGAMINAICTRKLPSAGTRPCAKHKMSFAECGHLHLEAILFPPIERTETQIERWKAMLEQKVIRMVEIENQYQSIGSGGPDKTGIWNSGLTCKNCHFQDLCMLEGSVEQIERMTVHRIWDPRSSGGTATVTGPAAKKRREEVPWMPKELDV